MIDLRANPVARALIGCVWGQDVATPDDPDECFERASRDVMVYQPDDPDWHGRALRLCPRHTSRVMEESTPREMRRDA